MIHWTNTLQFLNQVGRELVDAYKENLKGEDANASYNLSDSVEYKIDIDGTQYQLSLDLLSYWKYVEYGRRAGKMPPIQAIRDWVRMKPVLPRANKNGKLPTISQLSYLIARKIGEEGIEGRHILENSVESILQDFDERLGRAVEKDVLEALR